MSRPLAFFFFALAACGPTVTTLPDGGSCTPETDAVLCAAAGVSCGMATATDACLQSRALNCGACPPPTCPGGCPAGFTCNAQGVCAGGLVTALTLDVKTVTVSGAVKLNGATPLVGMGCDGRTDSDMVSLNFIETETASSVTSYVPCSASGFDFSVKLARGTYRVSVSRYTDDRTNLPEGTFVVNPALKVADDTTGVVLDVKVVPVSGSVGLNGARPITGMDCQGRPSSDMVSLNFRETASGTSVTTYVPCSATDFAFSTQLSPGTYAVTVSRYSEGRSNLPDGAWVTNPKLQVSGPTTDVVADVRVVPVSGTVKLNGAVPVRGSGCTGSPSSDMVSVSFTDAAAGHSVTTYVPCSATDFAFDTMLAPGTYAVSVSRYTEDRSNLPEGTFVVLPSLAISAARTGVVLDLRTVAVSGRLTLEGVTPLVGADCQGSPSSDMASISFVEATSRSVVTTYVPCSATSFTFSTQLSPGKWRALAGRYTDDRSNLPDGRFLVAADLQVGSAPVTELVLDVKTVVAGGTVRLNGALPLVGQGCQGRPTSDMVSVTFIDASSAPTFSFFEALRAPPATSVTHYIPCSATDFGFSVRVAPGTYRVSVSRYADDRSNLPEGTFVISPRVELK